MVDGEVRFLSLTSANKETPGAGGDGCLGVRESLVRISTRTTAAVPPPVAGITEDGGGDSNWPLPLASSNGKASPSPVRGSLVSAALHAVLLHDLSGGHCHHDGTSVEELGRRSSAAWSAIEDARRAAYTVRARATACNSPSRRPGFIANTQELQLVSVWLSQDCRTIANFKARISRGTPRRLWCPLSTRRITRGQRRRSGSLDGSPRLPPRRITSVKWERTVRELGAAQEVLAVLQSLEFGRMFNERLEAASWPPRVKTVVFDKHFNQPLHGIQWPPLLQNLELGAWFNQPIEGVAWPPSLRQLTFGATFNQPITHVTFPKGIEQITFGDAFNQTIHGATWPTDGPQRIIFGRCFNQPIDAVGLPSSLRELTLGVCFNQPIVDVSWPAFLRQLSFGWQFDQSLDGMVLPTNLEVLAIVGAYNRPLDRVKLPASLKSLTLGGNFDQNLASCDLPEGLECISLGWAFNQPISDVVWPASLQQLTFGYSFNQPINDVAWPADLQRLTLGTCFDH